MSTLTPPRENLTSSAGHSLAGTVSPKPTGMPTNPLVKYYGRCAVVVHSDHDYKMAVRRLLGLRQDLQQTGQCHKDSEWQQFLDDLTTFTNYLIDPATSVKRYQLEIVNDCLVPYIGKLKGRFYTDKARVHQLSLIMHALSLQREETVHTAISLAMLDKVRDEIRGKQASYMFKSELLAMLDPALDKQWRPILLDCKLFLQDMAGRLFVVFLITMIGWPLAFGYPIYSHSSALLRAFKEWETKKRVTAQSIFDLAKLLVLIFALLQIVSILSVYQHVGQACAFLAALAFIASITDDILKPIAPMLTPYALSYEKYYGEWKNADFSGIVQRMQQFIADREIAVEPSAPQENVITSFPVNERVVELTEEVIQQVLSQSAPADVPLEKIKSLSSASDSDDFVVLGGGQEHQDEPEALYTEHTGLRLRKS